MSSFSDNIKKANDVLGVVGKSAAIAGAVTAGVGLLSMAKRKQKRKEVKEDREFELDKTKLHSDVYLQDKKMNLEFQQKQMQYGSDLEKTKIIYENKNFKPNVMMDNAGNVMDNRYNAMASTMNTSNKNFQLSNNSGGSIENLQAELLKIAELHKNGILTDDEFTKMKAKILGI